MFVYDRVDGFQRAALRMDPEAKKDLKIQKCEEEERKKWYPYVIA